MLLSDIRFSEWQSPRRLLLIISKCVCLHICIQLTYYNRQRTVGSQIKIKTVLSLKFRVKQHQYIKYLVRNDD